MSHLVLVYWVLAVFSDEENAVDSQLFAAAAQRLGNAVVDRQPPLLCSRGAEVSLRDFVVWKVLVVGVDLCIVLLVTVDRDQLYFWVVPRAVHGPTVVEAVPLVLRVREVVPHGADDA